ncbi:very-long-chain 3-oxoacyl-CoA reductase-like [Branchiostoma floridae]|uniref:Very-long-chain 3-oxoacyl-CoA reductase-like n=1 Tax=Branchiostoma floridae TaxID=7739 RepID=A0A9J7KYZ4_BRAFL|nr:very-long-chain 3-oxoacyl-CoA reductase-like [Branchiostoma floridae]
MLETAGIVALSYIGFKLLWSLLKGIRNYMLSGPLGLSVNIKNCGSWAVVTGSTDGIGKAYAEELAARGLNIVLISRSEDKLKAVAAEIEGKAGVQTKIVVADFSSADIYDNISLQLEGLDIGCLVNNVGVGYKFPDFYANTPADMDEMMLNVNSLSVVKVCLGLMTRIVLPGMVERKKGVILNISSASGVIPTPLLSLYSASKAFVDYFSRCLAQEYRSKGIIIQSVTPNFVATKLSGIRKTSLFAPSPTSYVRSALNTVGLADHTFGYSTHALGGWLFDLLPQRLYMSVTMSIFLGVRKAALKKLQRKKEK